MQQVRVRHIEQKDRYHFTILWSDGRKDTYRLRTLQQQCPCVRCIEAREQQRLLDVNDHVLAKRIVSVGRYALRVEFTTGCSQGIYPFSLLRLWGEKNQ
ncbi:MAG: DUF971 domain-containing protein [Chlamydiota bacterium]